MLELLGQAGRGLSLSEVSRRLDLPKSTAHGLLRTLTGLGYVACSETTGRYFVHLKLVELGNLALRGLRLHEQTSSLLRALTEATRLTVHLAILDRDDVVLIEKLQLAGAPRVTTWVGRRMEVHCTGLGKAILAHLPEARFQRLVQEHGLPRHNENTITSVRRMRLERERTRAQGFAFDDEEDELGFRCVAAPIFDGRDVVAAVSLAGTTEEITPERVGRLAAKVRETAAAVSSLLERSHA